MAPLAVLVFILSALLSVALGQQPAPASILDFPYLAAVEHNGQYVCSATIIDDKYVMATNSCVGALDVKSLSVRVGTSLLGHRGQVFMVNSVSPYTKPPFGELPTADMAMLKVAVSFSYDRHVMWLNPNQDGIKEMQDGVLPVWADSKREGSVLLAANVYVLPSANCSAIYAGVMDITGTMYCLWPADSTSQPCLAGMGTPLYYNEQYYGLVTYNPGCNQTSLPVVVTAISPFTSYIISTFCGILSLF